MMIGKKVKVLHNNLTWHAFVPGAVVEVIEVYDEDGLIEAKGTAEDIEEGLTFLCWAMGPGEYEVIEHE